MEFGEKLQALRKKRGLTQEELGAQLFVSRTAISKWESSRGYPNIESLKAIASFFYVTVDELLSCEEILNVAEQDGKRKENRLKNLFFALVDISFILLLFLPFFALRNNDIISAVSLLYLKNSQTYLKIVYFTLVFSSALIGIIQLILVNCQSKFWQKSKRKISLAITIIMVVVFSASLQPYASIFTFAFLLIKAMTVIKL
jgi:transcriptional regulator with XRE-family HTH domain